MANDLEVPLGVMSAAKWEANSAEEWDVYFVAFHKPTLGESESKTNYAMPVENFNRITKKRRYL